MEHQTPQEQRETLLVALYDEVSGTTSKSFDIQSVGAAIGLEPHRAPELAVVLSNSGHIGSMTFGGTGMLTASGLIAAEQLKRNRPDRAANTHRLRRWCSYRSSSERI